jgi:hypothetical protein
MKLEIDMTVYHKDVYDGHEPLKVVGIRKDTVELEGDYSGGTHAVCQKDWLSISGVLFEKSEPKEPSPLVSLNLEDINGIEILQFLESQIDDNEDLSDISLNTPLEFEEQSVGETRDGELMYSLSFKCYFNNWGTHQPIDGNEIQITNNGVRVLVGEAFEGDGSDDELEEILTEWLKTHKFQSNQLVKDEFFKLTNYVSNDLYHLEFDDKERIQTLINKLVEAKNLMK